jgi:hypothetical protein
MRIVHVSVGSVPVTHSFGGAVQRRIRGIAAAQAALGHEVVVYSAGAAGDAVWQDGVEIRSIRCRGKGRIAWLDLQRGAVAELKRLRQRVDVIHFHNQPEGAVFARGLAAATFLSFDFFCSMVVRAVRSIRSTAAVCAASTVSCRSPSTVATNRPRTGSSTPAG